MNPISLQAVRDIPALHEVTGVVEGLTKKGQPARQQAAVIPVDEALESEFDTDAHAACYFIADPEMEMGFRLTKTALPQLQALGVKVMCSTIFLDLDLCHLLGKKGKVSWASLSEDEQNDCWELLTRKVPGMPPPACVHSTKNGAHFVHLLAIDVPAGAPYEAVLRRVHRMYNEAGLPVDPACMDWTRLYRLPRVIRDGEPTSDTLRITTNFDDDVYYVPEQDDLDTKDVRQTFVPSGHQADGIPTDEDAEAQVYDERGTPNAIFNTIVRAARLNPLGPHLLDATPIPAGKRNDTIVRLCGLVVQSGYGLVPCYGVMLRAIKLLDRDEDWRALTWAKLNEFRSSDLSKRQPTTPPTSKEEGDGGEDEEDSPVNPYAPTVPEDLILNSKGGIKICSANLRLVLQQLGIKIVFDEFDRMYRVYGFNHFGEDLNDTIIREVGRLAEEQFAFQIPMASLSDWLYNTGDHNRTHPVREYLSSLVWDGVPRVEKWLSTYSDAEDSAYTRTVGAVSLVACVRRIFKPGCKHDTMLLLEGPQGGEKSTALKVLAVREQWYGEDIQLGDDGKKVMENLSGKWIVEAAEVVGLRKGDTDKLKTFMSRTTDRGRMAYARMPETRYRQFVIFGTTNHSNYLSDDTGNRRFWPVHVTRFDIPSLRRDVSQLWAEAVELYKNEKFFVMDPSLYKVAAVQQTKRETVYDDPMFDTLSEFNDIEEGIVSKKELWSALEANSVGSAHVFGKRVKAILAKMGWQADNKNWTKGSAATVYDIVKCGTSKFKLRKAKK